MRKKKNDRRAGPAVEVDDLRAKAEVGAHLAADLADQEGSIVVADDRRPVQHQLRVPIVIAVAIVIAAVIVIVIAAVIGEADARVAAATSAMIGAVVVAIAVAVAARGQPAEARVHADVVAADLEGVGAREIGLRPEAPGIDALV